TSDAGIKPLRPTSTTNPPLTTSLTSVSKISPFSYFSVKISHDLSASTAFLDRIISSSSTLITFNVNSCPSSTTSLVVSICRCDNSLIGTISSVLNPISTDSCFSVILTTVPSITSSTLKS